MASVNNHETRIKKIEDRNAKVPLDAFSFKITPSGDLTLEYNTEFKPNFSIKNEQLVYNFDNTGEMNMGRVVPDLTPIKNAINYINSQMVNFVEIKKVIFNKALGNGTITLSESYKNFDYLEILYSNDSQSVYGTHRIPVCDLDFARSKNKPFELQAWPHAYWYITVTNDTTFATSKENSYIIQIRGVKMPRFTPKTI